MFLPWVSLTIATRSYRKKYIKFNTRKSRLSNQKFMFDYVFNRFQPVRECSNTEKLIFDRPQSVYECFDEGKSYQCYGFYFELDRKIADEPVFCFIGDPKKLKTMYDFSSRSEIKINNEKYLLPLGLRVGRIWRQWDKEEIAIPPLIAEIALTAKPLCLAALDSFMVKIELETEVKNLHYKHNQAKIEQIQTTIQDIDSQLNLFATNLGRLFKRIVKERNILNSVQDFPVNSPIELTQRNEDLKFLLKQFHHLDLPHYGFNHDKKVDFSNYRLEEDASVKIDESGIHKTINEDGISNPLFTKNNQSKLDLIAWKKLVSIEMIMGLSYAMIIIMTLSSIVLIMLE